MRNTIASNASRLRLFRLLRGFLAAGILALVLGPTRLLAGPSSDRPQLSRLGNHTFKITASSPQAQRAFDRGLALAYGFGHYAAEQEFRRAAALDPGCAMAWWGVALVNGPHINFPLVPPEKAAAAWEALAKAKALAVHATLLEQAFITALSARYANPQPEDRSALDSAYAAAMNELWGKNPQNADIATLCAEAAMDLHPWDLWKQGAPQPWTPDIMSTLERALEIDPKHPGANHLYVHLMEASPTPERALPSADRLRRLVPDSSHLVHMPAHIYARVDRWDDAATANRKAMAADTRYRTAYPRPGLYNMYMAHNAHFLAFVAMMQGRRGEALDCARDMVADVPEDFLKEYAAIADGYMIFVSEVLMRFGRWQEVVTAPQPAVNLPLSRALWHYTRTSALLSLNRPEEAAAERSAFELATAAVPKDARFGNNSSADILAIASRVIDGEMAAKQGRGPAAIEALQQAVRLEDHLQYDEPPDWIQPVRHTLGAVLLKNGRPGEAEAVYRDDLLRYPGDGWALLGLTDALKQQGKTEEAKETQSLFKKAWAKADIKPTFTCYCQQSEEKR